MLIGDLLGQKPMISRYVLTYLHVKVLAFDIPWLPNWLFGGSKVQSTSKSPLVANSKLGWGQNHDFFKMTPKVATLINCKWLYEYQKCRIHLIVIYCQALSISLNLSLSLYLALFLFISERWKERERDDTMITLEYKSHKMFINHNTDRGGKLWT